MGTSELLLLAVEMTWLVGKEARAACQASWMPQLGQVASSGGLWGQVQDQEQRLQLQRALHLLGELTQLPRHARRRCHDHLLRPEVG